MKIISRVEAKVQGLTYYFTGKPCKHGHTDKRRYDNGECFSCNKVKSKIWTEKNKKCVKNYQIEYQRKWRQTNKQYLLYNKKWRERNKQYCKNYDKQYRKNNKELFCEISKKVKDKLKNTNLPLYEQRMCGYGKKYRETHKEQVKCYNHQYRNKKSEKVNAWTAKRRAQKLQATPPWCDLKQVEKIYELAKTLTIKTQLEYVVDHVVPLQGKNVCGLHVHTNLRVILAVENGKKQNKLIEELL